MNEYRELYSDEAEHALLGALMLDGELFDSITASVTTADFHDPENAALYQVMIDLHATGAPVDPVTLHDFKPFLPSGGTTIAYAGELARNTPSTANWKAYARTVAERAVLRRLVEAADAVRDSATLPLTVQAKALLERYRLVQQGRGYTGQFLFPGSSSQALSATKASTMFTHLSHGEWSSHDLRKVARTAWTDLGVDYMVGELLLNHAMKDLDQAYIHTSAEQLKRQALETWHAYLDQRGFKALHGGTFARQEGEALPGETMNNEASSVNQYPLPRRRFFGKGDTQATPNHQPGDGNE